MKVLFYILAVAGVALMPILCDAHKQAGDENEPTVLIDPYLPPVYLNGGQDGLRKDLYSALAEIAPAVQDSVKGRAVVSFKISEEGIIDPNSITIMRNRSVPDDYMNAAIEAIKSLGKFEPGKMNGIPKKVTFNIAIFYPVPADFIRTSE